MYEEWMETVPLDVNNIRKGIKIEDNDETIY